MDTRECLYTVQDKKQYRIQNTANNYETKLETKGWHVNVRKSKKETVANTHRRHSTEINRKEKKIIHWL